jgi:membrane protease YdiL (CAAX protease family)
MLDDFLSKFRLALAKYRFTRIVVIVLWVTAGFIVSQIVITVALSLLYTAGTGIEMTNKVLLTLIVSLVMYVVGLTLVIGIPARVRQWSYGEIKRRLGLAKKPQFMYVVVAILGFVVYAVISYCLLWLAAQFLPGFNVAEKQLLGFSSFGSWFEVFVGFLTFVVLAPFAEELFFRGFLFGELRRQTSFVWAALITSILFGCAHGQLNIGIDTFALSLMLCFLYEGTGSIWPSIALHMLKNGIAFSFLLQASSIQ